MKRWIVTWIMLMLIAAAPIAWADEAAGDESPQRPRRPLLDRPREGEGNDRGDRPDRPRPFAPAPMLTDQQIAELLPVIRDVMPQIAERLEQLRAENPERFGIFVSHLGPRLQRMLELRQSDPQEYQRRVAEAQERLKAVQLARQIRQAGTEGQADRVAELTGQLRQMAGRQFDARQEGMEREVRALEQRIGQLREQLKDRAAQREQLIDQYVQRMLDGEGEQADQPGPPGSPDGPGARRGEGGPRGIRDQADRPRRAPLRDRAAADQPESKPAD